MYIGNCDNLPKSVLFAQENGLFVEEHDSPYLTW